MKTTIRGVILELSSEQKSCLDDLMDRYCAAVRWAYNRLLEGQEIQAIRLQVQPKFCFNSRQANDAVYEAQSTISSQKELLILNFENCQAKLSSARERLKLARNPRKIEGLELKIGKLERRLTKWQKFLDTKTLPRVVFGTKELFLRRCKGLISQEEWRDARSNRYLSRGDKTKGGNLNTRLYEVNGQIFLDLAAEPIQVGKSIRYKRITVQIYLARKVSRKTGKVNGRDYHQMVLDYLKTGNAYQVEVIRKNDRYYVHVTIEEEASIPYTDHSGAIGVDTNPTGLGLAFVDYLGQFKESRWASAGEWIYARTERRNNLIGEQAKKVVALARDSNRALIVENLNFRDDRSVKAKFNRISHGFVWSKFLALVERTCAREGVPLVKVKPPYTSVIGILKYQHQYGLSNHEAAGYVIGRRGLGFETEKVPKYLLKFISGKKQSDFESLNNWQQWRMIKKTILKRKEVKDLSFWQHIRKHIA